MHQPRIVQIVASSVQAGTCRYCRAPIVWAVTASRPGKPSRSIPFNSPRPIALHASENATTGVQFESWPTVEIHLTTCRQAPSRRREARA